MNSSCQVSCAQDGDKSFEEEVREHLLGLSLRLQEAHARQVHSLRTQNDQLRERCSQLAVRRDDKISTECCTLQNSVLEVMPSQPPASKSPMALLMNNQKSSVSDNADLLLQRAVNYLPCFEDDSMTTNENDAAYSEPGIQKWKDIIERIRLHQVGMHQLSNPDLCGEVSRVVRASQARDDGYLQWIVARPTSLPRMLWDGIGFFLVFFDLITLPVVEAFRPQLSDWYIASEFGAIIFWQIDMISQFFLGYYAEGFLEMRPKWTARHYFTGWFPFDFIVIVCDWYFKALEGKDRGTGTVRVGRTGKMAKIVSLLHTLRAFRLMRIWKYKEVFGHVRGLFSNELSFLLFKLVRLAIMVLLLNHFVACMWFALGTRVAHQERTWVEESLQHATLQYQYASSLHWAITQFTPASMEVSPVNVYERSFAICIVLFGLLVFSSVISSITGLMLQLRNLSAEHNQQLTRVKKYLSQNRISLELSQQLWNSIRTIPHSGEARIKEEEVELLSRVPENLRSSLREEIYLPFITRHPFFCALATMDGSLTFALCSEAMTHASVRADHEVFTRGSEVQLTFVSSGALMYSLSHNSASASRFRSLCAVTPKTRSADIVAGHILQQGDWMCEACLWMSWVPCGVTIASSTTELFQMNTKKFHDLVEHSGLQSKQAVARYGAYFVARLHEVGIGHSGMTDVTPDLKTAEQMVAESFRISKGITMFTYFAKHKSFFLGPE